MHRRVPAWPGGCSRRGVHLTAAQVRAFGPGKYHDSGGTGLFLRVDPSGARRWIQRLTIRGRRRELGLGGYSVISLAQAREQALENKRLVTRAEDPLAERRKSRSTPTFADAVKLTHAELAPTWKNPKDRDAFLSTLGTYIVPFIGDQPLPKVSSADLRRAILAARKSAPGVARKLTFRCAHVFRWGIAEGHCEVNPATSQALALPRDDRTVTHRRSLPYSEVAGCIARVQSSGAWLGTKLALEFTILTAARSGEVRLARWEEIDADGGTELAEAATGTWSVPAERMKMRRAHRVPLSRSAMDVLRRADAIRDDTDLLFPSLRGKALSDMTLSKLVKELGFDADIHGFRTSFRTWVQERTTFSSEVAEAALAHAKRHHVEAAYARSDLFDRRREMMEEWGLFLRAGPRQLGAA